MKIKRFTVVLLVLVVSLLAAAIPVALARGVETEQALAPKAACNVPSEKPLIATALADPSCDPITIKGGRFHETLVITRDVTIEGAQNATTIIDGDGNGTVIRLDPGVSVTMRRLMVTDGSEGGIVADVGTLLALSEVLVEDNRSSSNGGGISSIGTLTLTNSTVRDNVAENNGGGISFGTTAPGTLTLINSTVISNLAVAGGGLYNGPDGTVTGLLSSIRGNTAILDGGGIANSEGRVRLENSTLQENTAGDRGGGVFNADGVISVTHSTLNDNMAGYGGGYYHEAFFAPVRSQVENSTLSANTAITSGGGIFVEHGTLLVTNGTIYGNGAPTGGGVFRNDGSAVAGTIRVSNTIIAGSTAGGDCAGTVGSNDYNLAGDGTCTGFTEPNDLTNTDPKLGPLQNNGGDTPTHATLWGSPAVEGGSCELATDQRGVARPVGDACDIGAFENEGPFVRFLPVGFGGG